MTLKTVAIVAGLAGQRDGKAIQPRLLVIVPAVLAALAGGFMFPEEAALFAQLL